MKQILTFVIISLLITVGYAANWQTHTNTSHVYDLMTQGGNVYFSTWGGLVKLTPTAGNSSISNMNQERIWTTADGIGSNDIRNIDYINFSNSLWLGSEFNGLSIISPRGVQTIKSSTDLPSNRVTKIVEYESRILVSSNSGIALYYYLEGVSFPLQLHQYTTQNTGGALLSNEIDAMVLAPNKYLYVSSAAGINFVHLDSLDIDQAWRHFSGAGTPALVGSEKKLALNGSRLVIASQTQVFTHSVDPYSSGWQSYGSAHGIPAMNIASVNIDNEDRLWIAYGTWNEDFLTLNRDQDTLMTSIDLSGTVKHWLEFEAGLKSKSIRRIVFEAGNLYLCSWGDGIFRLNGSHWDQFDPNSIGFPKIRNIVTDQNHAAWFSSGNLHVIPLRKSALGASKFQNGIWSNYTIANSPIHTDNVLCVEVDSQNRKWFGTYDVNTQSPTGWKHGIAVWDEDTDIWKHLTRIGVSTWNPVSSTWGAYNPNNITLLGNTIGGIHRDLYGNMFIACYDRGFSVISPDDQLIREFLIPNSVYQRVLYSYHNGSQYFFGTNNDRGLVIWNHASIPENGGAHWLIPPPAELSNCIVYGVVTIQSPFEGTQHWIAASNGLFMWNEQNWYRYDTSIKRFIYNTSTGLWNNDLLYYVDEERLYGSVRTTPTSIYLDPFGRIWIGSLDHGISMYNPKTERFTNYYAANSPLLSNYIIALGYQPVEGNLLIGTPDGLNTFRIGRTIKPETTLKNLKAYPNPFLPNGTNTVQIVNQPLDVMPAGTNNCKIYDSSGALIITLYENEFSRFEWNGKNAEGKNSASGVYFFVVTDADGNSKRGKIALLR
ncbi:MAG: T9SS type A sorting domain-containing protein [Candidatus Cloacimonadaceae bacterium]|nr:T9SS type A sorting domain-containing protein [Candidatus Cloacimonadaceae bacterium]